MANVEYKVEEAIPQKKSLSTGLIALLALVVLVAGGTLAYLSITTNEVSNVFTAGNIKAELIEATWTADPDNPDGTSGSEIAQNMLPGVTAPKDPLIKNTSDFEADEWTGIMLTFQKPLTFDADGSVETWQNMSEAEITALLTGLGIISGAGPVTTAGFAIHTNWGSRIDTATSVSALVPGQWVFAYNSVIAKDASTAAIFDNVGILATAGNGEWDGDLDNVDISNYMTWMHTPLDQDGLEGHYQIVVKGAAVQGDIDQAEATNAILKLFGYTLPTP